MRLHFQGKPQTERQRGLPRGGKPPRRKAEFQDTPSTNCSTSSRSHSLVSVPSHQHLSHDRKFTSNQKGTDQLQMAHLNFQMEGTACQEHPGDSWGPTRSSEVPLVPRTSRCPKRSQNRHTPNTDPTEPRGWFPRYLIFSLVKWWCGKAENWYLPGSYSAAGSAHLQSLTRGFLPV